jgi:hypothetical protein
MQPDFGTTVSSPQGEFSFPRSYVEKLVFTTGGWPATYISGVFVILVGNPLAYTEVVIFRDYFPPWSSNGYTLDGIVQACFYYVPGSENNPSPATIGVNYFTYGDPPTPSLQVDLLATGLPWQSFPLPGAPPGYWLKNPSG